MKDGIQTYEFKFKFNAQDSKKQLKAISNDVLQMIHNMDTASNKMKVFTNFVGYLEKLDVALDQFKAEHKNDFANLFGNVDGQLAKSLQSALGLSADQLGQLGELKGRIDKAFANKANTEELRKIAQDVNALFVAIGRPEELDIDGLFKGNGKKLEDRIGALNNALYKFYLQYQLITDSIKNGFMSGGMQGFNSLSEDAQKEVKKLSDTYDELITIKQKLQKAHEDINKIHSKNNKKIVDQYKIDLTAESVGQLMTEFDSLNAQIQAGDASSKEYYENLLKMTDVILKLNSALKTIHGDNSLMTVFQGINVGDGHSHMFDKLSKYTNVKATQFENNFLGKTFTDGLQKLMEANRSRIEKIFTSIPGGIGGGFGTGSGDGDGEKQVSLYKQLTSSLHKYKKAYAEYKALEDDGTDEDELEAKGDQVDELKEKILQLVDLSEEASNAASDIFNAYENGKYNSFDQLVDGLTQVLGITKEINEEGSHTKLKTYDELLKIVDKITAMSMGDFDDAELQKLIGDLKDLYATEEQFEQVDEILKDLMNGEVYDHEALATLKNLFGIEIPNSIRTAAQKYDDFFNKINEQKSTGLKDEFAAGQYLSEMEQLKNELQILRDQGRITEDQFNQIQKTFDKDVKSYVDQIINTSNVLKELNKLNQEATLTDDKASLEIIVQKRREILAAAEQNGALLANQLIEERAITDEIEKRIGLQKQDGRGNDQGSGNGGIGTGNGNGSGTGHGDVSDENEQYEQLLRTIDLVTQAVNNKTNAFVAEKNTVDEVVTQEIESLNRLSDYLGTIKTAAQNIFGEKQGIVNTSVKAWQQSLEAIYNTMQSISNMKSVDEMLARMTDNVRAASSLDNANDKAQKPRAESKAVTDEEKKGTKVDFTSLEKTITSAMSSLEDKLDGVLQVQLASTSAAELEAITTEVKALTSKLTSVINDYKTKNVSDQQQAPIDAMKNNLLQLQKFVSDFNNRKVDGKYQSQELTGAILSDGSISVGYGEDGKVPWDRVANALVANLTKSLVVDLHSHPLKKLHNGQMYVNDAFSGSGGDLAAFKFSKSLGAQLAAEITGNIIRTLDLSKLSETQMSNLRTHLQAIEKDYANKPEYSQYIVHEDGKIKYNVQSDLQGQHQVTQILESMMYEAFKQIGYSKDKVDKEIFKKYDLTDEKQLTELALRLVQLSSASQTAIEPLERLKTIVSAFNGNLNSQEAKTAFEAFTKGEMSASDVFNQLNGKGHKISQETVDSLFKIDSANEIPAIESLLTQVTSILNTINSSISSIDGKITTNTGKQFDSALNDLMEFNGLHDLGTEIVSRLTSSVESQFDKANVSEYKVKELSENALKQAQDLSKNFIWVSNKNGQISVEHTQVMLEDFISTLRAMSDAMAQEELYRERTGKKVLSKQGTEYEDDLVTTFYAVFSKDNIKAMRDLLARGREKWQAQKDSYGDSAGTKIDPVAESVDSLTTTIGELQTVVSGLQQYIASPQFMIKADTTSLEDSLSSVSTEINTSAQRIADAVNDFDRKVNYGNSEYGQVSINKDEITSAMKEAMFAKDFAANYEKAQWGDIFESNWDGVLDEFEYINKLTGEVFSTFEEADEHFDKYFSNFYKSLDESFIGTKEEALEHLIQSQNKDNDFATVIVKAIQDQTGKIVNAIKVVLPDSISSNTGANGAIVNEGQIENAFQYIAKRASKWSDMTDRAPRDFFNSILRGNGNVQMDRELEDALHTLGMLSSSGRPTFKVAQEGLRNLGVAIAEDFALPSRPIELNQVDDLKPLLDEATKLGAVIPRIVSSFTDDDRVFELQTKMKGSNIASSFDWLDATVEQIDGFIHTLEVMNKVGLYPDFIGDNVLFDKTNGFSLVDIETQPLRFGINSAEDMGNWFMRYLNGLDWDGRTDEFNNFIDLFRDRLYLPADQRFVNENTIAQKKNVAVANGVADTSGLDDAIGKIIQAANAIEGFVSSFGDAVNALMRQIPSGPNAEIELYDPNEYQDVKIYGPEEYQKRAVLHFGDLYDQEDEMSKNAIDDLALFRREFEQLWDTMAKDPLNISDVLNPTDAEKAQVLDIFEQIKQKNLEIANNPFVTEEDLQRLRQLKAEVIGLQNELRGASIGVAVGDDDIWNFEDSYRDIYGLGGFDAGVFANYIHGSDMHSRLSDTLSEMLHNKIRRVDTWAVSDEIDDALITNRDTFNKFLLEHAKRLLGEKSMFDPDDVKYEYADQGDAAYDQDNSNTINNEVEALTQLADAVNAVKTAVTQKTDAFVAEGAAVDAVVGQEVAALFSLVEQLENIHGYLQTSFGGSGFDLNSASLASLQNLLTILGDVATQLQLINTGFDTLNNTTIPNVQVQQNTNQQQQAPGGYALENTLQGTTRLISEINSKLGANGPLTNIVTALNNAVAALKQIAAGVTPGGGSGTGAGGGGGQKRKTITTDQQNLLAQKELDKQTGDASITINKFGDETLTTTKKVGTEIVKIVKTTTNGITTSAIQMSNEYKNAMEDTYQSILGFDNAGLFGEYNQNGAQVDAQNTFEEYKDTYTKLKAAIQQFENEFKNNLDTTKTQANIDSLQTKLDGLESKLIGIAKSSKAFLGGDSPFKIFTQDELNDSGSSLKALVVMTEQLAAAFRGVHEDGRKVIYDVLENGVIKSYALEVDEATGLVKKMELSEYGLVSAMQQVNKVAKQSKELDNILGPDDAINDKATVLQSYMQKRQDLEDVVQDAWHKAQNNGGIIDGADLDIIYAMSQEVLRLGKVIQSEYDKISKLKGSGGMFEALGSTSGTTEERMRQYLHDYAYQSSKSLANVQYDSATKTMMADLVDLSGEITKVKVQYNELFDGAQITSMKDADAIDDTAKKIQKLQTSIASLSGFIDQNSQEWTNYQAALLNLSNIINGFNNGTLSFNDANIAWWNQLRESVVSTGDALLVVAKNNRQADKEFGKDKTKQIGKFNTYKKGLDNVAYVTQDLKDELTVLETLLHGASSNGDLDAWSDMFDKLKVKITSAKEAYESSGLKQIDNIYDNAKSGFGQLDFKANTQNLTAEQQAIVDKYNKIKDAVKDASDAVKEGSTVDIAAIKAEADALDILIKAYKDVHNIENAHGSSTKKAPKASQVTTAGNRYFALANRANADEFKDSSVIKDKLTQYKKAYEDLVAIQSKFKVGETLTADQEKAFGQAQIACADYARELKRLMDASDKLVNSGENVKKLEDGDWDNRKNVLREYVQEMYGSSAAIGDFDKNFTQLLFTVNNGDGTFTNMSAVIDDARSKIVALTGSTKEATGGLAGFWNDLKNKFKSIGAYLIASVSFHEAWQVVRQGIEYIREIDSALTELKKVTNETDATYSRFLQSMSKTASVVGSTVAELTTMAADWARLGYSMEEAGKLAKSTAILLNVSEFENATDASEALISTMQAFQYTADDSQHVVDILNEVGNNFAVSSDGLAIALQDSASALMEAGNNLEQSVALIAAANKVLQDPNSVGSALRTISLRLRGTSVEVLEELGEETDGAVESVSKMQEKLKALTGVDILTDAGAYKDTYTILKEIAEVWETMDPMNQAAALELMAGKNRANALAAILGNIEDLKGAYESALNAEGSAMRENEAYLDSIQGRIDLFNNAMQTFWMNLLNTDLIKGVVDIGTDLLEFADTFIGKLTAIVAIITVYKKIKDKKTFAQMFEGAGEKISAFANSLKAMTASTNGAQTAVQGLWTIIKNNPLIAATILVTGFAIALDALHTTAQEAADSAKSAFDDIRSVVESTQSTIQSLESELSLIGDKIDELSGKELSFADKEELGRLEAQREELEHSLKVQQQLLKLQTDSKNKQAVASMKAYTAAASQGAEETQNAWQTAGKILGGVIGAAGVAASVLIPGDFGTIGAGALAVAKALGSFGGMAAIGAGAFFGDKAGEAIGSERTKNDGTYDAWYDTYAKAIDTARAEEEKALAEYQKDHSNIDKLDKWQEAQQKTIDIETEMYDHLSQMQQYYNGLEYGQGFDKELDQWYNFLDKMSIANEASGAKETAIDRIFGQNASAEMQSIRDQILKTIADGEDFDFEGAINGSTELQSILNYLGLKAEDLAGYFNQISADAARTMLLAPNVDNVQTYSKLSEGVSSYNDLLAQTAEIVSDNTKVTQEYKDTVKALGISEAELSECFDENNGLVVKNAKALNKLVKSASKNVATNVKLAKSQARLEYYDLVKQINNTMRSTNVLDDATKNSIQSTLDQIDAVEKALYQYQLLEDTLLGVNNAFDKFAKAQEIDSMNTYGDSYVEMAQTMYDALYKTGQVGTEAFWSSVESLVPDSVYQGLTDDADRMKAIYDYYNKSILPSLRLDNDSLSLDYDAVENFVKEGLASGVFTGDTENFNLVEGMNLEKAAELMGMTKTQAYALFAELDKYNAAGNEHSFLSQLDDSLEGKITNITNDIEDLNRQKIALLEDGGYKNHKEEIDEINKKLSESKAELIKVGQEAYNAWQEYTKNDAVIAALSTIEDKQRKLTQEEANTIGIEWDEVQGLTVQQAIDYLLGKKLQLEEPTVLTAKLAIENIDAQIAELEGKLAQAEKDPVNFPVAFGSDIETEKQKIREAIQQLKNDKATMAATYGIELSEEDKNKLIAEFDELQKYTFEDKVIYVRAEGVDTVKALLGSIDTSNVTKTVTTKYKSVGGGSNGQTKQTHLSSVNGTAHANGSFGVPKTETALVGELGPEMLVRNGRWTTVGDNGAEFTQVKKGDIIFNHKQTEDLLSKGYVTGRGKLHGGAFASGTAYSSLWKPVSPDNSLSNKPGREFSHAASDLDNAASSISDAADEFREVFDWIEVRLEEINEDISLRSAELENEIGYSNQNKVVDKLIDLNQKLYDNLIAGANRYYTYAEKLLAKVPAEYRQAAQDGTIAIEEFVGKTDEKTLEAIQEYREWVQKGADATQQAEETLTEISALAKQAIDNISQDFENKASLNSNRIDQLEAYNALLETDKGFESEGVYQKLIDTNNENIEQLKKQRDAMQAELNEQVKAGNIQVGSQDWYDAVNDIAAVDTEIIELTTDTENYQDAINELHWDKFDVLMSRLESVSEEAENLIDILGNKDLVDEAGNWTDEGITSLGLYAQQMEAAEVQAKKYQEEIDYLNENWQDLGYTEQEYIEKLDELKDGQYDAIKSYHDAKDAIVDLNKERIDAIKKGIEKEIEAYEELIKVKKAELDAEKDMYDFQKSAAEKQKNIDDIRRKLDALSGDNSASARAKRAQLEADLAEALAEQEELYYDRSIQDQQDALDKELENFQEAKDKEMEGWDEYLENTEQVVSDSLATVQANTDVVYKTLLAMGEEYGLSIAESITSPWTQGEIAIQSFSEQFGLAMSSTVEELEKLELEFKETMSEIENAGINAANAVKENAQSYTEAQNPAKESNNNSGSSSSSNNGGNSNAGVSTAGLVSSISGTIYQGQTGDRVKKLQRALNELGYGNYGTTGLDGIFGSGTLAAVKAFQRAMGLEQDGRVGPKTKEKFKLKGYAKGSKGLDKDQLALIDELGDELQLIPDKNGRLSYMKKGTGIVPADLTANLMGWGKLDPSIMLDQNRPQIGVSPSVINNTTEIHIDASVGELLHVEHLDGNNPAEITKIVDKAWDKHMKELNAHVRRYTNR